MSSLDQHQPQRHHLLQEVMEEPEGPTVLLQGRSAQVGITQEHVNVLQGQATPRDGGQAACPTAQREGHMLEGAAAALDCERARICIPRVLWDMLQGRAAAFNSGPADRRGLQVLGHKPQGVPFSPHGSETHRLIEKPGGDPFKGWRIVEDTGPANLPGPRDFWNALEKRSTLDRNEVSEVARQKRLGGVATQRAQNPACRRHPALVSAWRRVVARVVVVVFGSAGCVESMPPLA